MFTFYIPARLYLSTDVLRPALDCSAERAEKKVKTYVIVGSKQYRDSTHKKWVKSDTFLLFLIKSFSQKKIFKIEIQNAEGHDFQVNSLR